MSQSRICAVVYDHDQQPDAALAGAVRRVTAAGLRPGGLLQDGEAGSSSCCATLFLEDIGSGRRIQAFETRGAAAGGCRLDTGSLAEAAGWLREAIEAEPDVLFINRFGRQEGEGRGLRDEIGTAVMAELPIVVGVSRAHLSDWQAFIGEESAILPANSQQIAAWCLAAAGGRSGAELDGERVGYAAPVVPAPASPNLA